MCPLQFLRRLRSEVVLPYLHKDRLLVIRLHFGNDHGPLGFTSAAVFVLNGTAGFVVGLGVTFDTGFRMAFENSFSARVASLSPSPSSITTRFPFFCADAAPLAACAPLQLSLSYTSSMMSFFRPFFSSSPSFAVPNSILDSFELVFRFFVHRVECQNCLQIGIALVVEVRCAIALRPHAFALLLLHCSFTALLVSLMALETSLFALSLSICCTPLPV